MDSNRKEEAGGDGDGLLLEQVLDKLYDFGECG